MTALVAAVVMTCVAGQGCTQQSIRLESKMCGQHSRAEIPVNGQWVVGEARVVCAGR